MRPLVILRPEPGASATAAAAGKLGLPTIVMPIFAVEPVEWRAPDAANFDALLLTSANAIRHGGSELGRLKGLPAHCVGEATAAAAREAGFDIASASTAGVDVLLESLPRNLRLLHLCGSDRREPRAPTQSITAVPVYRAVAVPPPDGFDTVGEAVVAVHSPRAASRFAELADERVLERETIAIAAISPEAARAAGPGWRRIEAAAEPTDTALLALGSSLCNNR